MSWDIVVFNSKQKINAVEEVDEALLVDIDFNAILEQHFFSITCDKNHRTIKGENYIIDYYTHEEPVSNTIFHLYGEPALFELIRIAKIYNWQIFDTSLGEMLDLEYPEKNGYDDFQNYLKQVLKGEKN
ncbi:hypothetical protein OC25_23125 [Pedobacter kyungheensis]|uniref:Uncharacterized protein n=1 Tax=Pedobacter kyungheensis TaxID=1069985 RepID=A0A0C1FTE6_9SPHI|nr:hypothetical protein [Pedobacter kyungheensis]KIA91154.1 hypothetical protein OC25_23125 [Pedobacter kyungheensis]